MLGVIFLYIIHTFLKQIFFILEKKCYRESYISDDLDLEPPGSESSPGLSRHSTGSSGIEADARQHSIYTEVTSMEGEGQQQGEKCLSPATSHSSSCTSGSHTCSKTGTEDQQWRGDGENNSLLWSWCTAAAVCLEMSTKSGVTTLF